MADVTIADLLQRFGLAPDRLGNWRIERATAARRDRRGHATLGEYIAELRDDPAELDRLLEEILVHETRFFRHPRSFDHVRTWLRERPRDVDPLRVLSAACSSGEEPYSLVLLFLGEGFSAAEFHIDAVDLSGAALQRASNGSFTERCLGSVSEEMRSAHFSFEGGDQWQLSEHVRSAVNWHRANLLEWPLPTAGPYDIVFCRNLLIYLDSAARGRLALRLQELLAPLGSLYVGQSELDAFADQGFAVKSRTALSLLRSPPEDPHE